MQTTVVCYKVKADRVAENEAYIRKVFVELNTVRPVGLHYASFKLADGASFMHVVAREEYLPKDLNEMPAFQAFTKELSDRCEAEEQPTPMEVSKIGSYGVFTTKDASDED